MHKTHRWYYSEKVPWENDMFESQIYYYTSQSQAIREHFPVFTLSFSREIQYNNQSWQVVQAHQTVLHGKTNLMLKCDHSWALGKEWKPRPPHLYETMISLHHKSLFSSLDDLFNHDAFFNILNLSKKSPHFFGNNFSINKFVSIV